MKSVKHVVFSIIFLVSGLLIAFGPQFIFKICDQHHGEITNCFWTARALLGTGILIALLGILSLLFKNTGVLTGLGISILLNSLLAFLISNVLIGMCEHSTMDCRLITLPVLNVISIPVIVLAAVHVFLLSRSLRKEEA